MKNVWDLVVTFGELFLFLFVFVGLPLLCRGNGGE